MSEKRMTDFLFIMQDVEDWLRRPFSRLSETNGMIATSWSIEDSFLAVINSKV
ncbi:hypothetical protein [Peribacillus simplex]|uniref:hypothetical protein n=1 Tax=Peribacillus simplex TaxID=1478 RepID=UPI003D2776B7